MSSTQSVIQFGLKLLKKGRLEANELASYSEAFSILGIDTTASLKLAALASVFSARDDQKAKYYKPSALNPEEINYPCNNAPVDDIPGFGEAVGTDSNALTVLEKFGTFVSVASIPSPDSVDSVVHSQTPVYDLFKTAAAIDDCLKTGESEEKFLLVGCDFSGIQDTVYTITSKGALKTLRARSFMLELLTEHIIHEILTAVNAGRHAIIYSGGGGFGLLLPNKEKTASLISDFAERLNEWAFDEFSGRFYIALDVLPATVEKVALPLEFKKLRQGLSDRLDLQKRKKFHKLYKKLFTPEMPEQLTVNTECQITRRDDLKDSMMFDLETGNCMKGVEINKREDSQYVWVSENCYRQFNCGDDLIDAKCIVRNAQQPQKKGYFKFPDVHWRYEGRDDNTKYAYYSLIKSDVSECNIWHINDWSGPRTLLYANYVRKCGDLSLYAQNKELALVNEENIEQKERSHIAKNTASFTGLASSACGADLIGALRMDVDGMGDAFCMIDNPVELSAKSRLLNLFFKVYLNEICQASLCSGVLVTDIVVKEYNNENAHGKPGRNVSVIYAGGDDLFIVGAWDETTELSFDIQRTFELFTQEGLTITGGLTLHQPKFPLYQMARKSAEAEAFAKRDIEKIETVAGKNRIALFFDDSKLQWRHALSLDGRHDRYMLSMKWSLSSAFLIPLMKIFMQCGKRNPITENSRDFVEINAFSYGTIEKWFSVLDKYHERHLLYLPTMARVLKGIEHEFGADRELFDQLVGFLYTKEENWIPHFHIALNWLTYLRRIA